jgi:hypothetical protein
MRRRRILALGGGLALSALAGCSGTGDDGDGARPTTQRETTETDTVTEPQGEPGTIGYDTSTTSDRTAELLDMTSITFYDEQIGNDTASVDREAWNKALRRMEESEVLDLNEIPEEAEPFYAAQSYNWVAHDEGVTDENIRGPGMLRVAVDAAQIYASEELGYDLDSFVVQPSNPGGGNTEGKPAESLEVYYLNGDFHGTAALWAPQVFGPYADDAENFLLNSGWEGHPTNDVDPMSVGAENLASTYNEAANSGDNTVERFTVYDAIKSIDPHLINNSRGGYQEVDDEGVDDLGEELLSVTGQESIDSEAMESIRSVGSVGMTTLRYTSEQNYIFREAESEYERQDRFTIPHLDKDFVVELKQQ